MKIYIAGLLWEKENRGKLEKVDKLCKKLKFETFLPHRDVGIYKGKNSIKFFKKDRDMINWCDLMIALLDWKGIGSGTAWEIGYAYAKGKPVIGLVEDMSTIEKEFRTCVMCFNSVKLVDDMMKLKEELIKRI